MDSKCDLGEEYMDIIRYTTYLNLSVVLKFFKIKS